MASFLLPCFPDVWLANVCNGGFLPDLRVHNLRCCAAFSILHSLRRQQDCRDFSNVSSIQREVRCEKQLAISFIAAQHGNSFSLSSQRSIVFARTKALYQGPQKGRTHDDRKGQPGSPGKFGSTIARI